MPKEKSSFKLEKKAHIACVKDYIWLVDLKTFNKIAKTKYKSTKELYFSAPSLKKELKVRQKLSGMLSNNPIIVLDKIKTANYTLKLKSLSFSSTTEILSKI